MGSMCEARGLDNPTNGKESNTIGRICFSGSGEDIVSGAGEEKPIPEGPAPLWCPGGVPGGWADLCGFIKPPGTEREWRQIRVHGSFEISRDVRGIRESGQCCHHEMWVHLLHVNAHLLERERASIASRDRHDRRPLAGTLTSTCDHSQRDHSRTARDTSLCEENLSPRISLSE